MRLTLNIQRHDVGSVPTRPSARDGARFSMVFMGIAHYIMVGKHINVADSWLMCLSGRCWFSTCWFYHILRNRLNRFSIFCNTIIWCLELITKNSHRLSVFGKSITYWPGLRSASNLSICVWACDIHAIIVTIGYHHNMLMIYYNILYIYICIYLSIHIH